MNSTQEAPDIQERYVSACHTSNLRVEADRAGAADVIIASGKANVPLGQAMMHLHTEYTRPFRNGHAPSATDVQLLLSSLKTLPRAVAMVTEWAAIKGLERPAAVALAIVTHWLDDACLPCGKLGKEKIPGTSVLSNRNCKVCKGQGVQALPYGEAGRKVEAHINDCVAAWRHHTTNRLHGFRKP